MSDRHCFFNFLFSYVLSIDSGHIVMERTKRKVFITLTFFFGLFGVALMIAAFGTDHWIRSSPVRPESATNNTGGSPTRNTGNITFGLFRGYRVVDYGSGPRTKTIYGKFVESKSGNFATC